MVGGPARLTPPRPGAAASPSREDPAVAGLAGFLGGPVGDHAAGRRWWVPARTLLVVGALAWVAGLLTKTPCVPLAWTGRTDPARLMCADEWGWSALASADRAFADGLPPLPWLLGRAAALVAGRTPDAQDRVVLGAAATAVLVGTALLLAVALLARVRRDRPWDAAVLTFSPLLVLTWATSWHALAAACLAAALWAWSAGRPVLAGVAVGAAAATVLPAALLLVGFAVASRGGRPAAALGPAVVGAGTAWLSLGGPHLLPDGEPFVWWVREPGTGSGWLVLEQVTGHTFAVGTVTAAAVALWAVWAGVVVAYALRARRDDPLRLAARTGLLLVGGAYVVSPSLPPSAGLVLLPLAAVAVTGWGPLLLWQAAELLHVVLHGWYGAGLLAPTSGGQPFVYWLVVLVRLVAVGVLLAVTLRALARDRSDDVDAVEGGRGVADPDLDLLAHGGDPRP